MKIETHDDFREARKQLGWSHDDMARALRLEGSRHARAKKVHDMEIGVRSIGGPTMAAVQAFLDGYVPEGLIISPNENDGR